MSYYPILKAPGCQGWTTLCNFPPNNWETRDTSEKRINVTWAAESGWKTETLGVLAYGAVRTIGMQELAGVVPAGVLALLSLTTQAVPACCDTLPHTDAIRTTVPAWRATLGLSTPQASTSYQGEIDPFPVPGSLLTFSPFIQFGPEIENYLIFLNVEKNPAARSAQLDIYDSAAPQKPKGSFQVGNNDTTAIRLDGLGFGPTDLPLIVSKGISGIPLYFSRTTDGSFLSLEHTHPPASYVIHGKRFEAQKILKNAWLSKVAQ